MSTYTTIQGDMWDTIANKKMGSTSYMGQLIMANLSKSKYFVFPAGITLTIPDIDTADIAAGPPWRTVNG